MRTLRLTSGIFGVLVAFAAAAMLLNRMIITANAGGYSDTDFWVLMAVLGFAAWRSARTIMIIQDKPASAVTVNAPTIHVGQGKP